MAFFPKQDGDVIDKLVAAIERWASTNPQEKVYLHTDKPYYLVGDTIWFKAYLTIGSKYQRSALSGALYVDLINEGDSVTQTLKLPVSSGISRGNFVLNDSTGREGNYRIRAYTQWMRNAGPDYFYDQTFSIGNAVPNAVFATIDYRYGKKGEENGLSALITYTDEQGRPYANKQIKYQIKESYKTLSSGGGKTDALGQISINLPKANAEFGLNALLNTSVSIDADQSIRKTFPIRQAASKTDIQFFPEGGYLVDGVTSRVAFKAIGSNGLGVEVTGVIVDEQQHEVAQFKSMHLGMGTFLMNPEAGKIYIAKVNFPDGSVSDVKLPIAVNEGYVFSAYPDFKSDTILIRINTNALTLKKGKNKVNLIGQSSGTIHFAAELNLKKGNNSIYLPLKEVSSGILQFTIFSMEGNPLNERIVFVKRDDQMNLELRTNKAEYRQREKVELELEAKGIGGKPLSGNFSVSVISMDAVPSDESNEHSIFSQLLLNSDIKGYIEKPNYYFQEPTEESNENLDILMLTQGYRRFAWEDLLTGQQIPFIHKAEKMLTDVTGTLSTFGNKPIKNGKVLLANNKLGIFLDTVTNDKGQFKYSNLLIPHGVEFTVQGRTAKNGERVVTEVDLISEQQVTPNKNIGDINQDILKLTRASIESSRAQDLELEKFGKLSRKQQLREVQINASKKWNYGSGINENQADEVFRPDSRNPCKNLKECLEQVYNTRVRFIQEMDDTPNGCGPIWVPKGFVVLINGMLVKPCDYQSFFLEDPIDVEKIYFSYESAAISAKLLVQSNSASRSVMAIYTKSGVFRRKYESSVLYYKPKGYDTVKEFYSPKYDKPETSNPVSDLRSTIYWNPVILTNSTGKTTFNFYNSNQTGTYRVIVEGIGNDGLLGRKVFTYKVNK